RSCLLRSPPPRPLLPSPTRRSSDLHRVAAAGRADLHGHAPRGLHLRRAERGPHPARAHEPCRPRHAGAAPRRLDALALRPLRRARRARARRRGGGALSPAVGRTSVAARRAAALALVVTLTGCAAVVHAPPGDRRPAERWSEM